MGNSRMDNQIKHWKHWTHKTYDKGQKNKIILSKKNLFYFFFKSHNWVLGCNLQLLIKVLTNVINILLQRLDTKYQFRYWL